MDTKYIEKVIFNKVLYTYFRKNGTLPPHGKGLVQKNIIKNNDVLDYTLELIDGYVNVVYSYYEDINDESKFITSLFKICKK